MIPDVVGPAEAAKILGVSRQRMHVLSKRPEFPQALELEIGRVYDGPTMRAYAADRSDRTLRHQRCLLRFQQTHNIAEAARYAPCDVKTARRWLQHLGAIPAPK